MDKIRKSKLMAMLLTKKEELLTTSKKGMATFINGDSRKAHGSGSEDGDISASLQIEDVSIGALRVRNDMLRQIEKSLLKLKENEYGICDECGEEIDEKRLRAMPFAVRCRDCQETKELFEKTKMARDLY